VGNWHMRSHKCDHLSSKSEEDAPIPKRRRKKQKLKLSTTMKLLGVTWGSVARYNGALEMPLVKNSQTSCSSCRSNMT